MRIDASKSVFREILRRSAWVTLGSLVGRALPILASMMISRAMGLQKFAVVGLIMTWSAIVPSLSTWGIGLVATQMMARHGVVGFRTIIRWSVWSAFVVLLFLHGILLVAGTNWIADLYPGLNVTQIGVGVLAAGALSSLFVLIQAFLNGSHRPRALSSLLALSGVLQGIALCLAGIRGDMQHLVDYLVAAILLTTCVALVALRSAMRGNPVGVNSSVITMKEWLRSVLPSIAASAAVAPVAFICASMLGDEQDGMRQLGAFFALEQIAMVLTYVPTLMVQSTVPVLASLMTESRRKAFDYVLRMGALQLAALVGLVVIAVPTAPLVLGAYGQLADFRTAYFLMLGNVVLSVPLATLGAFLQASGKFGAGSALNLLWAATFIGGSVLMQKYGCSGIQIARLFATCVLGMSTIVILCQIVRDFRKSELESGLEEVTL